MERLTSRRIRWTLFISLALLSALCLPQAASACYSLCTEVSPDCYRCAYTDDPGSGCANYPGNCGCYDVMGCWWLTAEAESPEATALATLGFIPADLLPAASTAEPATAPAAD